MDNNNTGKPGDNPGDQKPGSETELEPENKKPEVEKTPRSEEVIEPETPVESIADSNITIRLSSDEEKIIDELEKEVEEVTKDKETEDDKIAGETKVKEIRTIDNSKVPKDIAELLAKAIVTSIDTMQSTACRLVSQRADCEWHFNPKDKDSLIDAWLPVTKKWGDKIPVEIIAIVTTISVIGTNVGVAVASRPKSKKETKEEEKK